MKPFALTRTPPSKRFAKRASARGGASEKPRRSLDRGTFAWPRRRTRTWEEMPFSSRMSLGANGFADFVLEFFPRWKRGLEFVFLSAD